MGLLTIIKKQKRKDKEIRVLTLGLDNAGKTTIIKRMLRQDNSLIAPTMGFEINTLVYGDHMLNIWDIGGQTTLRAFWGNYFDKTDVVIWVVDGLSIERLDESFKELYEKIILQQDRLMGLYLCIVVNKIDLIDGEAERQKVEKEVEKVLGLDDSNKIDSDHWCITLVSGKTGEGIDNVLDWIVTRDY